jgi:hypothetical protein
MGIKANGTEYKITQLVVDNVNKVTNITLAPVEKQRGAPAEETLHVSLPASMACFSMKDAYAFIKTLPSFKRASST